MRDKTALVICWFFFLPVLRSSFLLAQVDKSTAISKPSELTTQRCDSLKNPVQGESLADASRRMKAWQTCLEKDRNIKEFAEDRLLKSVDVYKGRLAMGAKPRLGEGPTFLLKRLDIYVLTSSPWKYQYTLTASCGTWNKTISGSVEGSDASPKSKVLGEPTFSLDVVPPCNLNDISLELSQVRDSTGKEYPVQPEPKSASLVPGVSDDEMAQRLRGLQASAKTKAEGSPGTSISDLQKRVDEACKQQSLGELANGPVSSVGDHITACAKAYDDLTAALKVQGEAQNKARAEALNQPVPSGVLVVRLTGTGGLPFSGTCYYTNRAGTVSKSYDEVVPFQVTMNNVDNVNCSFVSKSDFRYNLKLEIIKDGKVIGESDTDAPYGVVGVARDVN